MIFFLDFIIKWKIVNSNTHKDKQKYDSKYYNILIFKKAENTILQKDKLDLFSFSNF